MRRRIRTQTGLDAVEAKAMGRTELKSGKRSAGRGRYLPGCGLGLAAILMLGVAGCHKTTPQSSAAAPVDQNAGDPADANMASGTAYAPGQPAQVLGQNEQYQAQQQGEDYAPQQQGAPIEQAYPAGQNPNGQLSNQQAVDLYASDLTDEEASQPPPPLPEYDQPPAPDPNDLWTPGYWAWGSGGYYWVPGCWVAAPYVGALWTPGYWGYVGGRYRFHHGFWGLHIGYYGGIDYGYGYTGYGYYGGYWNGGNFFYNTAVNHVNGNAIRNVYSHNVVVNNRQVNGAITDRVSFNGGRGGIAAQPRPAEIAALHEQRIAPMASQVQVQHQAAQNRQQFYSANKGRPAVAANAHPVVADRAQRALPRVAAPAMRPSGARNVARPGQMQPASRPGQPQVRQGQAQARPEQPRPEMRQAQPQARQAQPEIRQQAQPVPQRQAPRQPEQRPQEQARPQQAAPQARARPASRPEPAPHPQPQARQERGSHPQQGDGHQHP